MFGGVFPEEGLIQQGMWDFSIQSLPNYPAELVGAGQGLGGLSDVSVCH